MTERASSIVKTERGYAFSVVVRAPVGDRAAVYSQRDGRWSVALVGDGANYTSLATDGRALMLAVVYADRLSCGNCGWSLRFSPPIYKVAVNHNIQNGIIVGTIVAFAQATGSVSRRRSNQ